LKRRNSCWSFNHIYFSRTKDLADEFAISLDMADEVILLPIYPARESPVEGVTSELLLQKMKISNKQVLNKEDMQTWVERASAQIDRNGRRRRY
jgi:UDP-N-acetylmuramate-alanine ligase